MRTIETQVYSFEELSQSAKDVAIERFREINTNFEWYEPIFEDIKEQAAEVGFDVGNIYYSGFWSQGDGAMFEYGFEGDKLLEDFISTLDLSPLRKKWLYNLTEISGNGVHRGHYYHEKCCSHSIYFEPNVDCGRNVSDWINSFASDFEDFVIEKYEDLCRDLYRDLEKYYDELTSDEYVAQAIIENDYEFYEDGSVF